MISLDMNIGQIINTGLVGAVGWFIKREIAHISEKLEAHDRTLFDLNGTISKLSGQYDSWSGQERRARR